MVDYRGLNAQTQHDSYTLPLIEDMLQKQHRRRIFTVIDLKHGYHQMPLAEESRACTAMSTPLGPLQWKVMPMGVTNGNAAFQRMLDNLLELLRDCADPFVDDVIIASGDPSMSYEEFLEAHERDVTRVLDLLVRHKLTGSSDKATIAVSEVVFAGHVVGNGQRKPIPGKVAAIEHWEKPETVFELRAYLGFCNYYSGYIKMYAEYAAPMMTMLKGNREETKKGSKKALVWNEESDRAFEGMKQALLSAVVSSCALMLPTTPLALCWSKCLTMGGTCQWPSGAESWRKARDGRGRPEKSRRMPSSWLSGNGLGT